MSAELHWMKTGWGYGLNTQPTAGLSGETHIIHHPLETRDPPGLCLKPSVVSLFHPWLHPHSATQLTNKICRWCNNSCWPDRIICIEAWGEASCPHLVLSTSKIKEMITDFGRAGRPARALIHVFEEVVERVWFFGVTLTELLTWVSNTSSLVNLRWLLFPKGSWNCSSFPPKLLLENHREHPVVPPPVPGDEDCSARCGNEATSRYTSCLRKKECSITADLAHLDHSLNRCCLGDFSE